MIGQLNPSIKDVNIYGAGISGLLCAYYLEKKGYNVTVFEPNKVGGILQTIQTPYGPVETAANAIIGSDEVLKLITELNLTPVFSQKKLKRKIWRGLNLNKSILSIFEIAKIFTNSFKKIPTFNYEEISVYDFFLPFLGEKIIDEVLSPALGGIYLGPSQTLHFKSIFPIPEDKSYFSYLVKLSKNTNTGRGSFSFNLGMQELINKLYDTLKNKIKVQTPSLDLNKNNILCVPAYQAAEILKDVQPELSADLKKIFYLPTQSTTLFLEKPINALNNSFGMLFSKNSNFEHRGILNNSAIFPNRSKSHNIYSYTFIGQFNQQNNNAIESDLKKLNNNMPISIIHQKINFWKFGIPLYDHNRYLIIEKIKKNIQSNGLILFGNYSFKISIRDLISQAKTLGE